MAKQNIFVGSVPNDRTGTNMREAGTIIKQNFGEIYTALGDGTNISVDGFVSNTDFQATLANTNSSIATTAATERAALANTNAYIATVQSSIAASAALGNTNLRIDLVNTNLTTTNTAIRTLVNDRVQVANAALLASNNDFLSTSQMRLGAPVKTTTANTYTLAISDAGFYHRVNYGGGPEGDGSTSFGVTIPNNSTEAIPVGSEYMFIRTGGDTPILFVAAGGVTINSDSGKTKVAHRWQSAVCKKVDTNEWDLIGNLT